MSRTCRPAERVAHSPLRALRRTHPFRLGPLLLPLLCCAFLLIAGSFSPLDDAAPASPPRFSVLLLAEAAIYTLPSGQRVMPGPGLTAQSVTADSLRVAGVDVVAALQEMLQQVQQLQADGVAVTARVDAVQAQLGTLDIEATTQSHRVAALLTPVQVQAVAGSSQAEVSWSRAVVTVKASPGAAHCTSSGLGGAQHCRVAGLTNGVNYTFTARLTNAAEIGPVSPPSNSVRPALVCRALLVATAGDGGAVSISPTNSAGCPPGEYSPGTAVTVTAIPESGFGGTWSGGQEDSAGQLPPLSYTVIVDDASSPNPQSLPLLVASFAPCFALTVNVAFGMGGSAVVASPNSSAGCAANSFVSGSRIILKATPNPDFLFVGWSGTQTAGADSAVWSYIMPSSSSTQSAMFAQCLTLSVDVLPGDGSGGSTSVYPSQSAECPPDQYLTGTVLTLAAAEKAGWTFTDWSGTQSSGNARWSYTMGTAAAVQTAQFKPCFAVSVTMSGVGGSSISMDPSRHYNCAADHFVPYAPLVLTAVASAGYAFDRWEGDIANDVNPLEFDITSPVVIEAFFVRCYALTVQIIGSGNGTVDAVPPQSRGCEAGTYRFDASVKLTATVGADTDFLGYGGIISRKTTTATLYMPSQAATVLVTFILKAPSVNASSVLGQLDLTSTTIRSPAAGGLNMPYAVAVHPLTGELFVADHENHRVLVYPGSADSTTPPTRVIGQSDFSGTDMNRGAGFGSPTKESLANPEALAFEPDGGLLVADQGNYRVLYFSPGASEASRVYGQLGSFTTSFLNSVTADSLYSPSCVAVGSNGTVPGVYIADSYNRRVLFFAGSATTASQVWGQTDFASSVIGLAADGFVLAIGLAPDDSGGFWVADAENNRVLYFPAGSRTAARVVGQPDFMSGNGNRGGTPSAVSLFYPFGLALRPDGLYVADSNNNRILRFPLWSDSTTPAERVWGQQGSFVTAIADPVTKGSLSMPYGVAFDAAGNMLVADRGNNRVLRFAAP